ncbi:MAG TPA: hypothetical protein VJV79_38420 [Polyangiaceae bacterium]|nr:hypothetical protein [Polyangiaceae bacterium]
MRVPQMVSDFFEWRWAPCAGLTAGSLAFVALALLAIPTRIGGEPRAATTLRSLDSPQPQRALYASTLAPSLPEPEQRRADEMHAPRSSPRPEPPRDEASAPVRRGFSPIIDRPEPLSPPPMPALAMPPPGMQASSPAPAPSPTQMEPPAPVPGSVVVIQPVPGGESREAIAQ